VVSYLLRTDGQRFPTSGKIRNAKAIPKYFAYGKGIGIYTHTVDQYPQFGTQIVSVHERDATYVLKRSWPMKPTSHLMSIQPIPMDIQT
jgi:TnpA family transposase